MSRIHPHSPAVDGQGTGRLAHGDAQHLMAWGGDHHVDQSGVGTRADLVEEGEHAEWGLLASVIRTLAVGHHLEAGEITLCALLRSDAGERRTLVLLKYHRSDCIGERFLDLCQEVSPELQ